MEGNGTQEDFHNAAEELKLQLILNWQLHELQFDYYLPEVNVVISVEGPECYNPSHSKNYDVHIKTGQPLLEVFKGHALSREDTHQWCKQYNLMYSPIPYYWNTQQIKHMMAYYARQRNWKESNGR